MNSPFDLGRRLWSVGEYAAALVTVPPDGRRRWLAAPALLFIGESPSKAADDFEFQPTHTDVTKVGSSDTVLNPASGGGPLDSHQLLTLLIPAPMSADASRLTLGRASICDVFLPMPGLSKVHAYFHHVRPDSADVEDAGSTNGTFVAGVRLTQKKPAHLVDGTRFNIGGVDVEFCAAPRLLTSLRALGVPA